MAKENGYEISPMNPGWIKKRDPDSSYADDDLKELILFFVINTPCTDLSSSSIRLSEYGWGKDIWKDEKLKKNLFGIAGIKKDASFSVLHDDTSITRIVVHCLFKESNAKSSMYPVRCNSSNQ